MALYNESDLKNRLNAAIEHFSEDINTLRVGRATESMFDRVFVVVASYGNTSNPLKTLALINIRGPLEIMIKPYDPNTVDEILKALVDANLGFTPNKHGNDITINLPPMTAEKRDETADKLNALAEEARVKVRLIRQEFMEDVKNKLGVSEDEQERDKAEIQKQIDATNARIEEVAKTKESEIMEL